MNITLNDKPVMAAPLTSLGALLADHAITPAGTAVAVNGTVIPPALWAQTILNDGDSILAFRAFYGG